MDYTDKLLSRATQAAAQTRLTRNLLHYAHFELQLIEKYGLRSVELADIRRLEKDVSEAMTELKRIERLLTPGDEEEG